MIAHLTAAMLVALAPAQQADTTFAVRTRVNRALMTSEFVWIISELDVSENTLDPCLDHAFCTRRNSLI